LPVVAPPGTVTAILVALQLVTGAATPLNATVPVPWEAPKFVPVTITAVSIVPFDGLKDAMVAVVAPLAGSSTAPANRIPASILHAKP
jgi:hypothetical protein